MTLSEIYDLVELRFPDISEPLFLDIVNQVQMEFASDTKCLSSVESTLSVAGQRLYDLPDTVIEISRVDFDGKRISPIAPINVPESSHIESDSVVIEVINDKEGK